uniref:Tyr recombinase domain-containing protein n=1 Tax=Photinus pyralis TaxID=7054 RepID=A0A1Y1L726_PHOPY
MGISGACRREELCKMLIHHINVKDDIIVVSVPVGLNTIGKVPSQIAKYLNLQDPQEYTGHCFRRSSATLLANKGADFLSVKRHGGWRSSAVVEGYVEESIQNKIQTAQTLTSVAGPSDDSQVHRSDEVHNQSLSNIVRNESTLGVSGVSIGSCTNCTITVNVYNNN